jgi:hypothetical protein
MLCSYAMLPQIIMKIMHYAQLFTLTMKQWILHACTCNSFGMIIHAEVHNTMLATANNDKTN